MFDTNVFNRIADNILPLDAIIDGAIEAYTTHIQRDEIKNTSDPSRRAALVSVYSKVVAASSATASFVVGASRLGEARLSGGRHVPTRSAVWDVSKWDEACWSDEDDLFSTLKSELDELKRRSNNLQDALIAETAIKEKLLLVTDDSNLRKVTERYGGRCSSVAEFLDVCRRRHGHSGST